MFPLDGVSLQVLPEGAVVGVGLAAQFAHGVTDVHVVLCVEVQQCEKERKKDGSESESRVQVAGFEHHIIIGFPFFKTDQWMCKLQEDINIFF